MLRVRVVTCWRFRVWSGLDLVNPVGWYVRQSSLGKSQEWP